jgi:hypothetical protein
VTDSWRSIVVDLIGSALVIAAVLSLGGCGTEYEIGYEPPPCRASVACSETRYTVCESGQPVVIDCAAQGLWCRDVANQPPTCGLPTPRCLGCDIQVTP